MRREAFSSWDMIEQIPLFRRELAWLERNVLDDDEFVIELIGLFRNVEELMKIVQSQHAGNENSRVLSDHVVR